MCDLYTLKTDYKFYLLIFIGFIDSLYPFASFYLLNFVSIFLL